MSKKIDQPKRGKSPPPQRAQPKISLGNADFTAVRNLAVRHQQSVRALKKTRVSEPDASGIVPTDDEVFDGTIEKIRDHVSFRVQEVACQPFDHPDADIKGTAHRLWWNVPYLIYKGTEFAPGVKESVLLDTRGIFNELVSAELVFSNEKDFDLEVVGNVPIVDITEAEEGQPTSRTFRFNRKIPSKESTRVRLPYRAIGKEYRTCMIKMLQDYGWDEAGKSYNNYFKALCDFTIKAPRYAQSSETVVGADIVCKVSVNVDSIITKITNLGVKQEGTTPVITYPVAVLDERSRFFIQKIKPSMVDFIVPMSGIQPSSASFAFGDKVICTDAMLCMKQAEDTDAQGYKKHVAFLAALPELKPWKGPAVIRPDKPGGERYRLQFVGLSACALKDASGSNTYENAQLSNFRFHIDRWKLWNDRLNEPQAFTYSVDLTQSILPPRSIAFLIDVGSSVGGLDELSDSEYGGGFKDISKDDILHGITRIISFLGTLSTIISLF